MMTGLDLRPVAPLRLAPYLAPYGKMDVTKSDLIDHLAQEQTQLGGGDVELAVKGMLERMIAALVSGVRIEIRGFGSLSLHFRPPRMGQSEDRRGRCHFGEVCTPLQSRQGAAGSGQWGTGHLTMAQQSHGFADLRGYRNHPLVRQEIQDYRSVEWLRPANCYRSV
jgi:integration host factor subunit beta